MGGENRCQEMELYINQTTMRFPYLHENRSDTSEVPKSNAQLSAEVKISEGC